MTSQQVDASEIFYRKNTKSPVVVYDKKCKEYYNIIDESDLRYMTEEFGKRSAIGSVLSDIPGAMGLLAGLLGLR